MEGTYLMSDTPIAEKLTALARAAKDAGILQERQAILDLLDGLHKVSSKKNLPGLEHAINALIERGPTP
jgi:hypothetical protein